MDFSKIRTDHGGPRGSFEQLVCQLARRDIALAGASFRRIDGAGGDGGVECYWILPDSSEVGYQAKYHLKSADVDWEKINQSVEAALTSHPKLKRYVIALPCDLTDRTGGKGAGGTGWEKWEKWVEKWKALATSKSMQVDFVSWTAFDLSERLTRPDSVGLRAYWFGELELNAAWFERQLELATAALDDRFHPEDHVELDINQLFLTLVRDPTIIGRLDSLVSGIKVNFQQNVERNFVDPEPPQALIDDAVAATDRLRKFRSLSSLELAEPWDLSAWLNATSNLIDKLEALLRWTWSIESDAESAVLRRFRSDLHKVQEDVLSLAAFLGTAAFAAERDRAALIHGRAGSGKSHLLASEAQKALGRGCPAILLLGQQLHIGSIWPQILQRLGLSTSSPEEFLGALDAAAEAIGRRALILVDAINEGAGSRIWRNEIAAFLARLKTYPHIACVVSCRTEYLDAVLPTGLRETLSRFYVEGFRTPEEQECAARIYLDRRGIARPATPWLSPEFVNPLFLRSCVNALSSKGQHEFPKGLNGTKTILAFYLRSLGEKLDHDVEGNGNVTPRLIAAVRMLAREMADQERDYVGENRAGELIDAAFSGVNPPEGIRWIDWLLKYSALRKDPDPSAVTSDPLVPVPDVVRLAFQRFQEALMAEALLEKVTNRSDPFALGQPLNFIIANAPPIWKWAGLVEALSSQLPEKFGKELVDLLPGGEEEWWPDHAVVNGFAESIRWREHSAFSSRTLELLNALEDTNVETIALLLEVSVSIDHPYNATWLHRNLLARPLAERDAEWSLQLANEARDGHPAYRLVEWALYAPKQKTTPQTLKLCATTLTWLFSTPHRPLRDRATKALTTLLLLDADLFGILVVQFADVDDLYILERLFASAYGAACFDPRPERLQAYAQLAYTHVFAGSAVPLELLLRDYARGLIQLASFQNCVPADVSLEKAEPPYVSKPPVFDATKEEIDRLAEANGDKFIKSSCSSHSDFGHYEIRPAVGEFFDVRLTDKKPSTANQRFKFFEEQLDSHPKKKKAFERLWESLFGRVRILRSTDEASPTEPTEAEKRAWATEISNAEKALLKLLSEDERRQYEADVVPRWISSTAQSVDPPIVSAASAYLWVTRRAYEFGWTADLFPHDGRHGWVSGRERPKVERIGKKYQWLALSELLCRLADNNWMTGEFGKGTRIYNHPNDIGFMRDIDPTVLPDERDKRPGQKSLPLWASGPAMDIACCDDAELSTWPFKSDPGASIKQLVHRQCEPGAKWFVLFDHTSVDIHHSGKMSAEGMLRQEEFRILMSALVPKPLRKKLTDALKEKEDIDRTDWEPTEVVGGPYLGEAPWRDNWPNDNWRTLFGAGGGNIKYAQPTMDYLWESHLDASLHEGARCYLPSPWLIKEMELVPDGIGTYVDRAGSPVFISSQQSGQYLALIKAEPFEHFLERCGVDLVWTFIAERNTWSGSSATRRSEAVCWRSGRGYESKSWTKDNPYTSNT